MTISYLICIAAGFLMGSIMFSQILPEKLMGTDIQQISDDHNPGATNVFVNCGATMGMICLSLDIMKGFLPVFLAFKFISSDNLWFSLVMAAPVLGHAMGMFRNFHGGKCIATAFGVMLGIFPVQRIGLLLLAVLYIFFSTVVKIHPNRIRSIVVFSLFGLSSALLLSYMGDYGIGLGCVLVALIAIVKHTKYFCK